MSSCRPQSPENREQLCQGLSVNLVRPGVDLWPTELYTNTYDGWEEGWPLNLWQNWKTNNIIKVLIFELGSATRIYILGPLLTAPSWLLSFDARFERSADPPALLFLRIVLTLLHPTHIHMNLRVSLLVSRKKNLGILRMPWDQLGAPVSQEHKVLLAMNMGYYFTVLRAQILHCFFFFHNHFLLFKIVHHYCNCPFILIGLWIET